jgi:voltage-gated potassium channel
VISPNNFTTVYLFKPAENLRKKIYTILVSERNTNSTGRLFNFILVALIVVNIAAIILETVQTIYQQYKPYFDILEIYTLTIFTIEYFLQVWISTLNKKYKHPILGRIKFMVSPMAIIELLVIIPFLLSIFVDYDHDHDLRFLSILRFAMVLRIFKLDKYTHALETFKYVIVDKKEELVLTFFTIIILLVLTSCSMYIIEKDYNPAFSSIPETMWWATSTLTTVGYGDVVPVTALGKFLGSIIAILGIAMFAVPAGLISSSFTEYVQLKKGKKTCPHCSKEL